MEVLIALAIFAVAGLVSLQAYLSSIRHLHIITCEKNYILLSRMKIEEMKTAAADGVREDSGTFSEPFEQYEWELALSDAGITDTECAMTFIPYKLTVRQQDVELTTLTPFLKTLKEETAQRYDEKPGNQPK